MNKHELDNRRLYRATFSRLHASAKLDLEEIKMKSAGKQSNGTIRCKRGILVTALIMVMLFAMSAVAFAATDGEIVNDVKSVVKGVSVWLNGEKLDVDEVTKGEDGSISIDIHEGDQIKVNGDDYESSVEIGSMNGKLNFNEQEGEDGKSAESEIVIEEVTPHEDEPVPGWTPLPEE